MKLKKNWSRLKITQKFILTFFGLLFLFGGVTVTGWLSLRFVRRETETAIVTSNELQRLVFQMKAAFDRAREEELDFFQSWSNQSLSETSHIYNETHQQAIDEFLHHSDELQELLSGVNVSPALRQSYPEAIAYIDTIANYRTRFRQAVQLVDELDMNETGAIALLQEISDRVQRTLALVDDPELISLYNQMKAAENTYFLNRDRPSMNVLTLANQQLADRIAISTQIDPEKQARSLVDLKDYQSIIVKIERLEIEIHTTIQSFQQQAAELSDRLLELSNTEIKRAWIDIEQISTSAIILLAAAVVLAPILSGAIAEQFWWGLKQLEIEQEKSERLLLNILPPPIAERLKENEQVIADSFPEVTVLFADIAGFTPLSASLSPTELVQWLNEIFSAFDALVETHGLEKIKTIGDAYMVVGGLPHPQRNHAIAIAEMALDMQTAIQQFNQTHQTRLNMRIGIHTGPVVAGVIGTKKFIYDLWGDTVNTASRMESHGIVGNIQITDSTYQLIKDRYSIEKRGVIQVKGKGEMNAYLLKKRNPLAAIVA